MNKNLIILVSFVIIHQCLGAKILFVAFDRLESHKNVFKPIVEGVSLKEFP